MIEIQKWNARGVSWSYITQQLMSGLLQTPGELLSDLTAQKLKPDILFQFMGKTDTEASG